MPQSPCKHKNQHDREQTRTSTEAAEHSSVNIIYSFIQQDTHCVQGNTQALTVRSIHRQRNHIKTAEKSKNRPKKKEKKRTENVKA